MSQAILCMPGAIDLLDKAMALSDGSRGRVTADQALASVLSSRDGLGIAVAGLRPDARSAFLEAKARQQRDQLTARRADQAEQSRLLAIAQLASRPTPLAPTTPKDPMHGSNLSPSETTAARELFARMAQPLTDDERSVCRKLGISEDAYKTERDSELAKQLPGAATLSDEAKIAHAIGLTPDQYAEAKRLAG